LGVSNDVKKEIMDLLEAIYLFSVSDVNDLNKNDLYQKFKEYNETLDSLRLENF
jgi:hypothetical protein